MKKLKLFVFLMIGTASVVTGGSLNSQEPVSCADFFYVMCADWDQQCIKDKPCSFNTLGFPCDSGWEATGFPSLVLSNVLPNSGLGVYVGNLQGVQFGESQCGDSFECKCKARYISIWQTTYECSQKTTTGPWNWPDYPYLEPCAPAAPIAP